MLYYRVSISHDYYKSTNTRWMRVYPFLKNELFTARELKKITGRDEPKATLFVETEVKKTNIYKNLGHRFEIGTTSTTVMKGEGD